MYVRKYISTRAKNIYMWKIKQPDYINSRHKKVKSDGVRGCYEIDKCSLLKDTNKQAKITQTQR